MAKVTYASLKLKEKEDIKTFNLEDKIIEVKQYLSLNDKIDLIDITLQKSIEGKIYNPIKINAYFHLHLVYLYTNIEFTKKQREDEIKLFDILESNGIIDLVIENIPVEEYEQLAEQIEEKMEVILTYNTTAAAMVNDILEQLPKSAQSAVDILSQVNSTPFQSVIDFAVAANGGKELK